MKTGPGTTYTVSRLRLILLAGALVVLLVPILAVTASPIVAGVYYWGCCFAGSPLSPTAMPIPGTAVQVASSNTTQYALTSTGAVYAWGTGTAGQLGDGGTTDSSTAVQVNFPLGTTIASLPTDVMPNGGALAVDTSGNVWAWGQNVNGVDCMTSATQYLTPVELPSPISNVTLVSSASGHALYDAGGTLYACGGNSLGELGDGNTKSATGPVEVTGLTGQTLAGLYSSSQDAYALTQSGAVYAWGGNAEDELCNGSVAADSDVPVQVPFTDASSATKVAAGGSLATNGSLLVGLADGTFWACGSDTYGQLGDGGSVNQSLPIKVVPPAGVTYQEIAMSGATGYAVDSNGNVWAWGWDNSGQVGNGTKQSAVLTPVDVLEGQGVTEISGTAQDVVALPSITTAPTLTSATPPAVAVGASGTVTFSGTGFETGATIKFSGPSTKVKAQASSIVVTVTTLTARVTVPAGAALGAYTVKITNPDQSTATCTTCFAVIAAPTLASIAPPSAARGTTTSVTLTGSGFASAATVKGPSGATFTNVTVVNSTTITATMKITANAATGNSLAVTVANNAAGGYGKAVGNVLTIT